MPLPHFSNLQTTSTFNEPVYPSLYEVVFILPTLLQGRDDIVLLENATKVGGLDLQPDITADTSQRFKHSNRAYLTLPDDTTKAFDIEFNVNQNGQGSIFVWNTLKAWYDLAWNSQDGTTHYKADLTGSVIVNQHDKKGFVIRRVTLHNAQLLGVGDPGTNELDWSSNTSIVSSVSAKFISDYWTDEYIDDQFVNIDAATSLLGGPFTTTGSTLPTIDANNT
jgi:hypothetical protein